MTNTELADALESVAAMGCAVSDVAARDATREAARRLREVEVAAEEIASLRSEVARLRHALEEANAALNREHEAHARHAADRAREARELHKACEKWRRLRERDAAEVERLRSVVRDYMSRHDDVQAQTVHALLAKATRERDAAMRRAGFAEPLVNLAMAEGLRAVERAEKVVEAARESLRQMPAEVPAWETIRAALGEHDEAARDGKDGPQ